MSSGDLRVEVPSGAKITIEGASKEDTIEIIAVDESRPDLLSRRLIFDILISNAIGVAQLVAMEPLSIPFLLLWLATLVL